MGNRKRHDCTIRDDNLIEIGRPRDQDSSALKRKGSSQDVSKSWLLLSYVRLCLGVFSWAWRFAELPFPAHDMCPHVLIRPMLLNRDSENRARRGTHPKRGDSAQPIQAHPPHVDGFGLILTLHTTTTQGARFAGRGAQGATRRPGGRSERVTRPSCRRGMARLLSAAAGAAGAARQRRRPPSSPMVLLLLSLLASIVAAAAAAAEPSMVPVNGTLLVVPTGM